LSNLISNIKSHKSEVFRKAYIKRRDAVTGQFETNWYEITSNVKKWGRISQKVDDIRLNKFTFANIKLVVDNEEGLFNPHNDEASLWNGYLNQQRTLIKIEAGFIELIDSTFGTKRRVLFPSTATWDESLWDEETWDSGVSMFIGVISGDIPLSDSNEVTFNIKPLNSIFQDYPARNLVGWTTTGFTASQFVQMVMNQTDGSSNYIFLPFFGNTTTNYNIETTTVNYSDLNTITASGVYDKNVWEIIEKLAESESFAPFVDRQGVFNFVSRTPNTDISFEFHGAGSFNSNYGQTIKKVNSYGSKISKFYSRVEIKFNNADTVTSYVWQEGTFSVSPGSSSWVLGSRTLKIENFFIPDTTTAQNIASTLFTEYSTLRNEIEFTTSFIPHLNLLDRVSVYYDPSEVLINNLWDQNNWASDSTSTSTDLIFDASRGDAIKLNGDEFKFLSIEVDLDNLECKYLARSI